MAAAKAYLWNSHPGLPWFLSFIIQGTGWLDAMPSIDIIWLA
jgi:hypothetical protein